jgi:predicted metal-dependent phosphoesterase TrpH
VVLALFFTSVVQSQNLNRQKTKMLKPEVRKSISVPAPDGYVTLKGDFHMHSVFSDGSVWPTLRVEEAWMNGLDVIGITDHVEYRPNGKYLKADQNTTYEIALNSAKKYNITLVKSIEITKWKMPPGHMNAFFVTDGNVPELNDTTQSAFLTALDKLKKQGAFFLWNHPGWEVQQKDTVKWFGMHQELYEKGFINGIEIFNFDEWYPVALKWAVEKNLAPLANTDTHDPVSMTYTGGDDFIRPMTLIFAVQNTSESIREAMFAGRTVAWFNGQLAGSEKWLSTLFDKSLIIRMVYQSNGKNYYQMENVTDFEFQLKSVSKEADLKLEIPKRSVVRFSLPETVRTLKVEVQNWHVNMQENLIREINL